MNIDDDLFISWNGNHTKVIYKLCTVDDPDIIAELFEEKVTITPVPVGSTRGSGLIHIPEDELNIYTKQRLDDHIRTKRLNDVLTFITKLDEPSLIQIQGALTTELLKWKGA